MTEFNKERALARSIELHEKRDEAFQQLPDYEKRVARGDYDFENPNTDIELWELEQETQRNGFVLAWHWDGQNIMYTIEEISPEDHATYLAEERAAAQEDLKWRYEDGLIEP